MTRPRTGVAHGACAGLVLGLVTGGCSVVGGRQTAADCDEQVRSDGIVYSAVGATDRRPRRYAVADESDCHDNSERPTGPVFPRSPRQVVIWRWSGHVSADVVGVGSRARGWTVFIAETLPAAERDAIGADLCQRR